MDNEESTEEIKPVVIFTNFWDANKMIDARFVLSEMNGKLYKINLYISLLMSYNI